MTHTFHVLTLGTWWIIGSLHQPTREQHDGLVKELKPLIFVEAVE